MIFMSDPVTIKRNGDNAGYIYNPSDVLHVGESFDLKPSEKFMIIPHQPDDLGPWKQFRSLFVDDRFIWSKDAQTLVVMVENRWLHKIITVTKGTTLEGLIDRWGISHELSYMSDKDIEKIEAYEENIIPSS